ncbi:hypothetical protein L1887_58361 [Cichorium endivia]|nr:hypothetical protein L1887_58361 [Cichorium endivia]
MRIEAAARWSKWQRLEQVVREGSRALKRDDSADVSDVAQRQTARGHRACNAGQRARVAQGFPKITRSRLCKSAPAAWLPLQRRRAGKRRYQKVLQPCPTSAGIQSGSDGRLGAAPPLAWDRGLEQGCHLDEAGRGRLSRLEGAPSKSPLADPAALGVFGGLRCAPLWLDKAHILESLD